MTALLAVLAAGRSGRRVQSIFDDVTFTPIILTPSGHFTYEVLPQSDSVKFVGFKDSPSNVELGYFNKFGAVTASPFPSAAPNSTVPLSVTKGSDGNFYVPFRFERPDHSTAGSGVYKVTLSYQFTRYDFSDALSCATLCRSTLGPDGNVWVAQLAVNKVAKVTTNGGITVYPLPFAHEPADIVTSPDAEIYTVFFNGADRITTSGNVTSIIIPKPSALLQRGAFGADANLYLTDSGRNSIWSLATGGTDTWTEYPIPTPNSLPLSIGSLPDGNVWCTEYSTAKIARLKLADGSFTEYGVPGSNSPVQIIGSQTAAPNGYVVALDSNNDPHLFGLAFAAGPTPTPTPPGGGPTPTPTPGCSLTLEGGEHRGRVGGSLTASYTAMNGTPPYFFTVNGAVPGLTTVIGSYGVTLSGTLTTAGDFTYSVTVTDSRFCTASISSDFFIGSPRASLGIIDDQVARIEHRNQ